MHAVLLRIKVLNSSYIVPTVKLETKILMAGIRSLQKDDFNKEYVLVTYPTHSLNK